MEVIKRTLPKCMGLRTEAPSYSILSVNLFYQLINQVRQQFLDDIRLKRVEFPGEIAIGGKFTSNDIVFWTLRSWIPEEEFKVEPLRWIYDALQDCAERDWFYAQEKQF